MITASETPELEGIQNFSLGDFPMVLHGAPAFQNSFLGATDVEDRERNPTGFKQGGSIFMSFICAASVFKYCLIKQILLKKKKKGLKTTNCI